MNTRRFFVCISAIGIGILITTACAGPAQPDASVLVAAAEEAGQPDEDLEEHMGDDDHHEDGETMGGDDHHEDGEHMEGDDHHEEEHAEGEEYKDGSHMEGGEHMEDGESHGHGPGEHMAGAHDVPEEAAEVPNPIPFSDASVAAGAVDYAANCATCHGENGEGDGSAAAALAKKPANLHESHVQDLSDGALFHIITHGRPDTPMPGWEGVLDEDQRWNVVNFLRTFQE